MIGQPGRGPSTLAKKVFILLPSDESKLLARWQGPFEIQQRMGPTTYQVSTPGQSRSSRVLHVNLLKEWVERPDKKAEVLLIKRVPEDEEVEEQYLPAAASLHLDLSHLPEGKQLQVRALCNSISSNIPGKSWKNKPG